MKKRTTMLAAVLLLTACSTVTLPRPLTPAALAQINQAAAGRDVVVVAYRRLQGFALEVSPENTTLEEFVASGSGAIRQLSVPTEAVEEIVVIQRGRGALQGLKYGFLAVPAGALLGGVAGAFTVCLSDTSDRHGAPCHGESGGAAITAIFGAAVGLLVGPALGALAGSLAGHRETYQFAPRSDK